MPALNLSNVPSGTTRKGHFLAPIDPYTKCLSRPNS
jgi:hypothetical protein